MSKRLRNLQQNRALTKRVPLPIRAIGYTPQGVPGAEPHRHLGERHFERRARSLRGDRAEGGAGC